MSTQIGHSGPVGPDTLITIKVLIDGQNRRFKLALRDLGAHILPQKLRFLLAIPEDFDVKFDRFSDSAGSYIVLDSTNPSVYKQLYRAAKAKLKLRLRAHVTPPVKVESEVPVKTEDITVADDRAGQITAPARQSYLETVLSVPQASEMPSNFSVMPATLTCAYPAQPRPKPTSIREAELSRPTLPTLNDFSCGTFSIDCNFCGKSVPNEHYHCSICEMGDFDLCDNCVRQGLTCYGESHWLIKRTIKNGRVYPSTTETLPPKKPEEIEKTKEPTVAKVEESETTPTPTIAPVVEERTCNSCINQMPMSAFVTCQSCPDYDLCFACFEQGEHGHHPAHAFALTNTKVKAASMSARLQKLCLAGRGLQHDAICDGCENIVVGVRHKCLTCPDFDYCSKCVENAAEYHAGHRFAPLYEHLKPCESPRKEVHRGIFCDGPICGTRARKTWIRGCRYKCTVCHDTDFCANCEALPSPNHNKTHPLLKIKTPIRSVSISTVNEFESGDRAVQLGDRPAAKNASTETTRPISINAATQVQTVAEVKPAELNTIEVTPVKVVPVVEKSEVEKPQNRDLEALFESDTTADGTTVFTNAMVSQSWTLRNPGPQTWPAGCAVYYIGGDDMRNLDRINPSSISEILIANRSDVLEKGLEAGETATFTVMLKAPVREGRAISYWRLKTPEGKPFGHKLWVDITATHRPVSEYEKVVRAPQPAGEDSQESSTMIFPKLDKESPESSIHNVASEPSVVADTEATIAAEDNDLLEDLESLGLEDDGTEDGFMTDEEYDILDADDEDFLEESQHTAKAQK